jgi:hypothetical protein
MSYLQNENLIDITTIKTVRESLRYYQLHINKKINNIKYKIYDDDKIIDCGEITKKSEIDSHKTNIIFEYDLNKNYFIKIKYTLFGNNNVFSGHKFLLSNIVETEMSNIEQKNIKIKIKKDIKKDIKKEECLLENDSITSQIPLNNVSHEEEESSEEELESSASSSEVESDKESDKELNDNELITNYFENKYKFMKNNYQNKDHYSNDIECLTFNKNDDDDNDNDFDFNNI